MLLPARTNPIEISTFEVRDVRVKHFTVRLLRPFPLSFSSRLKSKTNLKPSRQLDLVDESHVDVYAFGLTTDFRARLFPGTQRLLEVADDVQRVQVEVLCWCGLPGLLNARVVDGVDGPLGRDRRGRRHRSGRTAGRARPPLPRRPLPGALPAALRPRRAGADAGRPGAARAALSVPVSSPVRGAPTSRI